MARQGAVLQRVEDQQRGRVGGGLDRGHRAAFAQAEDRGGGAEHQQLQRLEEQGRHPRRVGLGQRSEQHQSEIERDEIDGALAHEHRICRIEQSPSAEIEREPERVVLQHRQQQGHGVRGDR
jgi:hypothetical protein